MVIDFDKWAAFMRQHGLSGSQPMIWKAAADCKVSVLFRVQKGSFITFTLKV